MESLYRESLKNLRKKPNNSELAAIDWLYCEVDTPQARKVSPIIPVIPEKRSPNEVTEKAKVLDSLYEFGEEKAKESGEGVYKFGKGELSLGNSKLGSNEIKQGQVNEWLVKDSISSIEEYEDKLSAELGEHCSSLRLKSKRPEASSNISVIFVTDSYQESLEQAENEFDCFFGRDVSLLFSRMVKAMNLSTDQYLLSGLEKASGESLLSIFEAEIKLFRPKIIVSLGAGATASILKENKRLKDIHGVFQDLRFKFDTSGDELDIQLMPLFSPKLLQTAPNMKKAAWKDMQKIMETLGL